MYKFKRIPLPGWDYYIASPGLNAVHHVGFPTEGITPLNRYQLLMFISGPTLVTLDNPEMTQIMQPGQTSMEFDIAKFPKDALWIEQPSLEGTQRLCLAPVYPMRKWSREVIELAKDQEFIPKKDQIAILLLGSALIDGMAALPSAVAKAGEVITPTSAIRVLVAQ